jgi:hypothetical protein
MSAVGSSRSAAAYPAIGSRSCICLLTHWKLSIVEKSGPIGPSKGSVQHSSRSSRVMILLLRIVVRRHRRDFENKVVILTGTGESCCANPPLTDSANLKSSAWDLVYHEDKHLLVNHLIGKYLCRLLDSRVVSGSVVARSLKYFPEPRPALFPRSLPALRQRLWDSVRLLPWRSIP